MQDGGQDLVDSLNLVGGESNDFHGVGDGLEVCPVVDAGLRRKEKVGQSGTSIVLQRNSPALHGTETPSAFPKKTTERLKYESICI